MTAYWLLGIVLWPLYLIVAIDQHETLGGRLTIGAWFLTGLSAAWLCGSFVHGRLVLTFVRVALFAFAYLVFTACWLFVGIGIYNLFRAAAKILHLRVPIVD
ncbi:MAG: hypothetical protein ACM3NH_00285 [Candidatus Saccharibacteria bacterium]